MAFLERFLRTNDEVLDPTNRHFKPGENRPKNDTSTKTSARRRPFFGARFPHLRCCYETTYVENDLSYQKEILHMPMFFLFAEGNFGDKPEDLIPNATPEVFKVSEFQGFRVARIRRQHGVQPIRNLTATFNALSWES